MTEVITSDNYYLSQPIQPRSGCADDGTPFSLLNCSDPKIREFLKAATAPSTRRAYQSDLIHFLARGGTIPATAEQVARYLVDHASTHTMATLARRLAGIRTAYVQQGFSDPTKNELIRLILRGIGRRFGHPQRRAAALSIDDLTAIVAIDQGCTRRGHSADRLRRRLPPFRIGHDRSRRRRHSAPQTVITLRRSKTFS